MCIQWMCESQCVSNENMHSLNTHPLERQRGNVYQVNASRMNVWEWMCESQCVSMCINWKHLFTRHTCTWYTESQCVANKCVSIECVDVCMNVSIGYTFTLTHSFSRIQSRRLHLTHIASLNVHSLSPTGCAARITFICVSHTRARQDRLNCRPLLQKIVSFIGLFCKRDL